MVFTTPILGLISLQEILYLFILTVVVAYIFMGFVRIKPKTVYDMMHPKRFDFNEFKFAALVAAPGIILHELGHKFVAMFFGYTASFYIWPFGLFLGAFLKFISSPFIIIAPGYVGISGVTNDLHYRLIAFAGPLINLIIWCVCWLILRNPSKLNRLQLAFVSLTKKINGILLIFNMLPIPPLDGSKVIFGL